MLQKYPSAARVKAYRQRRQQGVLGLVPVPLSDDAALLLESLGYVQYPANRKRIAGAITELLERIDGLPTNIKVALRKDLVGDDNAARVVY